MIKLDPAAIPTGEAALPLAALDGRPLGPYALRLSAVTSRGYAEQVNFDLNLVDRNGQKAGLPVLNGIYSRGRPSEGVMGWIDGVYCSPLRFADGGQVDLAQAGLDRPLFALLGNLIPPGGRLMVAYEAFHVESPILRQTSEVLSRGAPPLSTPIGQLLFYADCWLGVRDWYISEGGREGPRKLQGNKALNDWHRRQRAADTLDQLLVFLDRTASDKDVLIREARQRGAEIVGALRAHAAPVEMTSMIGSTATATIGGCSAWA